MKKLTFWLSFLVLAFFNQAAFAQTPYSPVRCSYGNQDSSCATPLYTQWQAAPTCPADPGWTTAVAAQWAGSKYTQPQCAYQPPPSCPSGQVQTAAPVWNGSSWVGMSCNPPPGGDPGNMAAMCSAQIPAGYTHITSWTDNTAEYRQWAHLYGTDPNDSELTMANIEGPAYLAVCNTYTEYIAACLIRSDGSLDQLQMGHQFSQSSGQCNH